MNEKDRQRMWDLACVEEELHPKLVRRLQALAKVACGRLKELELRVEILEVQLDIETTKMADGFESFMKECRAGDDEKGTE